MCETGKAQRVGQLHDITMMMIMLVIMMKVKMVMVVCRCVTHLHIRATLTCYFWSWRQFSHPLRRLKFCFNIVAVHPSFITCYDIFQKVFISIRTIKQLLTDTDTVLFFVHLSADAEQILLQHDASSVCRSK